MGGTVLSDITAVERRTKTEPIERLVKSGEIEAWVEKGGVPLERR